MSFLKAFLGFNKIKRTLYMLSLLLLFLVSSITYVSCFDVGVSPGSICCGDWVTVTISLTNTGGSVFSGSLEIYIIDANGYQDRMDGLSITLQPHESRTFQTRIRPKDCKSYGTYQVVVKLIDNNGREQGTRTSSFVVKDPALCQGSSGGSKSGCTWTFTCDNNIVKRLCVDQNGKEYWKEYDNCNNYNPPRECINGVCVDTTDNGGSDNPKQTCNQQACQSQNRPIGTPYTRNSLQYQKYMECSCINSQCKCEEVEKEVPCTGIISGHVYNKETNSPIKEATLQITQSKYLLTNPTDDSGYFSAGGSCPLALTTFTCSAEGYVSDTRALMTNAKGDLEESFKLEKETIEFELISPNPNSEIDLSINPEIYIMIKSDNAKGGSINAELLFNSEFGGPSRSENIILKDDNNDGIYEYKIDLSPIEDEAIEDLKESIKMKDKMSMYHAVRDYGLSTTGTYKLTLIEYKPPTNALITGQFYAKSQTTGISPKTLYEWNWKIESLERAFQNPARSFWTGDGASVIELNKNLDKFILYLSEDNEGTAYINLAFRLAKGTGIDLIYRVMLSQMLREEGHEQEANALLLETVAYCVLDFASVVSDTAALANEALDLVGIANDLKSIFNLN